MRPRWLSTKKLMAALLMVPVLIGGTFAARLVYSLSHLTNESPLAVLHDLVSGGSGSKVNQAAQQLQRINIALYGYGGDGHGGAFLSDSIMIISIQPEANGTPQVAEVSVPRDWYVPINLGTAAAPKIQNSRINAAYSDGMSGESQFGNSPTAGAQLADATLENLLGIHIDHYVGVDFTAFKDAVDAVGGVDINVQRTFTDYQYPACENCGYQTIHFNAGVQHMNGAQALIFSRSRHGDNGEGSDFARSKRQQLIVSALKQKVVSIGGIGNLPNLLNALGSHMVTDLTVSDMEAFYGLVKNVDPATVQHVSIDNTNMLYDCGYPRNCGAYYLYAHDNTYATLHQFMANVLLPPAVLAAHVPVSIEDGSGTGDGAGARWTTLFGELGVHTSAGPAHAPVVATQVIDNNPSTGAVTAAWLASYFGVAVTTPPTPAPGVVAAGAQSGVTVILGSAEEHSFNNLSGSGD